MVGVKNTRRFKSNLGQIPCFVRSCHDEGGTEDGQTVQLVKSNFERVEKERERENNQSLLYIRSIIQNFSVLQRFSIDVCKKSLTMNLIIKLRNDQTDLFMNCL